jgi:hypothetical protein
MKYARDAGSKLKRPKRYAAKTVSTKAPAARPTPQKCTSLAIDTGQHEVKRDARHHAKADHIRQRVQLLAQRRVHFQRTSHQAIGII